METNKIGNKNFKMYFEKLFNIEIDYDSINKVIIINGEKFGTSLVNELPFQFKKFQENLLNMFIEEININILNNKETKKEYLLSIQKKNNFQRLNIGEFIEKISISDEFVTIFNSNVCKITSFGNPIKMGQMEANLFQLLNDWIKLTVDSSLTLHEELNNFLEKDTNLQSTVLD